MKHETSSLQEKENNDFFNFIFAIEIFSILLLTRFFDNFFLPPSEHQNFLAMGIECMAGCVMGFCVLVVEFISLSSLVHLQSRFKGEDFVFYVFKLRNFIVFNNQPS